MIGLDFQGSSGQGPHPGMDPVVLRWFIKGLSWGPKAKHTLAPFREQLLSAGRRLGGCSNTGVGVLCWLCDEQVSSPLWASVTYL